MYLQNYIVNRMLKMDHQNKVLFIYFKVALYSKVSLKCNYTF